MIDVKTSLEVKQQLKKMPAHGYPHASGILEVLQHSEPSGEMYGPFNPSQAFKTAETLGMRVWRFAIDTRTYAVMRNAYAVMRNAHPAMTDVESNAEMIRERGIYAYWNGLPIVVPHGMETGTVVIGGTPNSGP